MQGPVTLAPVPYVPQVDNYNAIEAFVRRIYNPNGDPSKDKQITIQPYTYNLTFNDLANGTTDTAIVNISANADFVLTNPAYQAIVAASGDIQDPLVKILLTDTGSQEQLMDVAVPINTIFAHATTAPNEMTYPRVFSGRSGIAVQVTNYSNILGAPVAYKQLNLAFRGVLVRAY